MKREELEARHFSWGFGEGYFYSKEQADSVMGAMEARIKEIEADKLRQENYCESLVNENKRLNEIIISKDMVGAELHNENKALRHNLEDWKAENEALKERIKELEDSYKYFKAQNKFHIEQSNELAESCRDKNELIETLLKRIKELEAMQPKWISVEERLPETKHEHISDHFFVDEKQIEVKTMESSDNVIVLLKNGTVDIAQYEHGLPIPFLSEEEWFSWHNDYAGYDFEHCERVTHWMPLPQRHKSED